MKRNLPKRSSAAVSASDKLASEVSSFPTHKYQRSFQRSSKLPTVVYFKKPKISSLPVTVTPIEEPCRDPGMIAIDHLTSVFSTSKEIKVEASAPSPSSNGDVSDSEDSIIRFTTRKKLEIQKLLDLNQCIIESSKDPELNKITKDDTLLAYQCALCLAIFSPITKSHIRKHLRRCRCKAKNQHPYLFNEEEKKQMNLFLAELSAIDGRSPPITETESFKNFINYIGTLCFSVGRSSTTFSIPPDFLPPTSEVKATVLDELDILVTKFQAFLQRRSDLHFTILLDSTSL
uniref:Uncharacterized protein n=1 Tax=Panagrolaimus sp. ES5 TaxID=591445 RepID=A0AC34F3M6_9BILA